MLFRKNPEFLKNLWIEISPTRLILMPTILGLVFYVTYLANKPTEYNPNQGIEALIYSTIISFIAIVFVWGSKLASDTIISEVNNRTWINQRLSALSPWQMTIGKMLGSTIYVWYGGFICGLVMLAVGIQTPYFQVIAQLLISLILGGIFVQGFTLNLTLLGIQKDQLYHTNYKSIVYFVFSLFIIALLIYPLLSFFSDLFYNRYYVYDTIPHKNISWFQQEITILSFYNLSGILFVTWVLIGIYQNIRSEFQFKNKSLVWTFFIINFILYLFGFLFDDTEDGWFNSSLLTLSFCTAFYYFLIFTESKDFVYLQVLKKHIQNKDWKNLNIEIPLWTLLLPFLFLLSVIAWVNTPQRESMMGYYTNFYLLFPLNIILFICRDTLLILLINISNYRRKELTVILFLGILYLLFPLLTFFISDSEQSLAIFFPVFKEIPNLWIGIFPIFAQNIIIAVIFVSHWKKLVKLV